MDSASCCEVIERCGNYADEWKILGKPRGWLGCSLPKGHEGPCMDSKESGPVFTQVSDDQWEESL